MSAVRRSKKSARMASPVRRADFSPRAFVQAVPTRNPTVIRSSYRDSLHTLAFTLAADEAVRTGRPATAPQVSARRKRPGSIEAGCAACPAADDKQKGISMTLTPAGERKKRREPHLFSRAGEAQGWRGVYAGGALSVCSLRWRSAHSRSASVRVIQVISRSVEAGWSKRKSSRTRGRGRVSLVVMPRR